jgi:hypothetical protein
MPPIVFENCSTALSLGGLRRRIEAAMAAAEATGIEANAAAPESRLSS